MRFQDVNDDTVDVFQTQYFRKKSVTLGLLPSQKPVPSTSSIINALSEEGNRVLWHQRLGHLHYQGISDLHKSVDGVPKIKHHCLIDKCPTCIHTKMRRNPVGHGNLREDAHCVGMGLSLDWGFIVQKSTNTDRIQKLTGVDGSQAYLLVSDHFSDHLWGISAGSKSPPPGLA